MRIMVYNIAYGTGSPTAAMDNFWTAHRFLRTSHTHLERIISFIDEMKPDIIGLTEVDTGSFRTRYINQVETIANHLHHYHHSSVKYGRRSLGRVLPIFRHQANAVLTRDRSPRGRFHFFPTGFKKLIIQVDFPEFRFFLLHLALQRRIRKQQLRHIVELARDDGPIIVAGDFNTFNGEDELEELRRELKLQNPNQHGIPTFPAWDPRRQLDFILCSQEFRIENIQVPNIRFSDHLPIILDINCRGANNA